MAKLDGAISITGLPPNRGIIVSLCFFEVPAADSPPPHDGDPPADAATNCEKIVKQVDLDRESEETTLEHPFSIDRPPGYYYVQLRAVLFRTGNGRVIAQAEQFFFGRRPVCLSAEPQGNVTFPVSWPALAIEELHCYGTVKPRIKRPWWRFW